MIYDLIGKTDFKLLYISHFFFLIFPFLYLRAVLNKKKYKFESTDILADKLGLTINPFVNGILNFICKMEFIFFKLFPFKLGGSMIIVCEKKIKSNTNILTNRC